MEIKRATATDKSSPGEDLDNLKLKNLKAFQAAAFCRTNPSTAWGRSA
jgi:hypothetical protein